MQIGGLEQCSLIDYPGKISAVVFTQGCNFRCGYCHNPELVYPTLFQPAISLHEIFEFLKKRKGKLDAVVVTGGEPTLQDGLFGFLRDIRALGFKIKLDTNGSNPDLVAKIIDAGFVDYLAMDIKGPLKKYEMVTCAAIEPEKIQKSIRLIMRSGIDYEFRTTIVRSQLARRDFPGIGRLINGARLYALQRFVVPSMYKIGNQAFLREKTYDDAEFAEIQKIMRRYVDECVVR